MVVYIVQMTLTNAIESKLKWHKRALKSNLDRPKQFWENISLNNLGKYYLNPKNPDT